MNEAVFAVTESKTNDLALVMTIQWLMRLLPKKARQHPGRLFVLFLQPDRARDFRLDCIIVRKRGQLEIGILGLGVAVDCLDIRHRDCLALRASDVKDQRDICL